MCARDAENVKTCPLLLYNSSSSTHHLPPPPHSAMSGHSSDTFYCNEKLSDADSPHYPRTHSPATASNFDEPSLIARLLDSESHHMPRPDYLGLCRSRSIHLISRRDSIDYIFKVRSAYRFKPTTAFLSVNYFDRFLSSHTLPESGWPFQLLSVACLSLAAKMEEICVPVLMDLQIFEPTYVFESKTIQRMELCVMATLSWRLRSVTPFDYLHIFISKFPSSASSRFDEIQSLASDIILKSTRVADFLVFPPSVMAAAALFSAAGEGLKLPETLDERVDKEMVSSCHRLMDHYLLHTCATGHLKVARVRRDPPPASPACVLDAAACVSSGILSENPTTGTGSVSGGEAEPEVKRRRFSAPVVHEPEG